MSFVIKEQRDQRVVVLKLNRPDKLNAFSRALCEEYLAALDVVEALITKGEVDAVVIDSTSEKAFCAGADLKEREVMNEAQIDEQLKIQRAMMDRTAALGVPTLAVLRGIAFGGGLELALSCDLRIAASTAQMGLTELRLGIIPGSGGTQRLTRLVGLAYAREMIMLAKPVDAARAESIGLVTKVGEDVDALLTQTLDALLGTAPLSQKAAKRAMNRGLAMPLKDALDFERQCYDQVLNSQDRIEGLTAFLAKRKPQYRGV